MNRQCIVTLVQEPYSIVNGVYRAVTPAIRVTRNQNPYQVMRLADVTGHINGYAWSDKYRSDYQPEDNDLIHVEGKTRISSQNGSIVVDIEYAEPVQQEMNPIVLLPECQDINTDETIELIQVIDEIKSPSLKRFLKQVFSDVDLALRFITGKASTSYHHSHKGGLLQHSLECVRMIKRFHEISDHELEIGIVAALLHDIVKTQSFYNVGAKYSPPMINHDARTLEKLAVPLHELENNWLDGAGLLRMILEYPLVKNEYIYKKQHVPAIVNLVWFADQLSTSIDKREAAFKDASEKHHFKKDLGELYWKGSPDNYAHINLAV